MLGVLNGDSLEKWFADPNVERLSIPFIFFYYFAFETLWQRTPGKFITGTKVLTYDGTKPAAKTIALRTMVRFVPFEPLSLLGKEAYGWHDKWSGTVVVRTKTMQQDLAEPPLQTEQCEKLAGITALSVEEYAKGQPQEETVLQAKAVAENFATEKHNVAVGRTGKATEPSGEEATHQRILSRHRQAKWVAVAILAVGLISTMVFCLSNTPTATRANNPQDWWSFEREDDRIEAFLNSREQLFEESLPTMENQSADDYLRAFLDIRKRQYAEDLQRCKSQEESEVVTGFWRGYFEELCGRDPNR
jgi:hypothetical protein